MTVNRGETFYPRNDTTIDTGASIDVRHLSSSQSNTNDVTQTCTATQTQDNVSLWFDPATTGNTDTTDSNTTLVKRGWALRLTEDMTPEDDTNCDAILPANTTTVTLDVGASWSGAAITGNTVPTFKASLWRYNPSTDAGTLIAAGTSAATTWQNLSQNGTFKTVPISITVPQTTFSQGEILMIQIGMNTGTLPNPLSGTTTWVFTLRINNATTNVAFATGTHLLQLCSFTNNLSSIATPSKNALAITPTYSLAARGSSSFTRVPVISKSFAVTAMGTTSRTSLIAALIPRDLTARGEILTSGSNATSITIPIDEIPTGGGSGTTYIFPILD